MSCHLLAQQAWCTTPTVGASAAPLIIGAAPRRTTPTAGTSAAPLIIGTNALPRRALFALLPAALAIPGVPAPAYASGGATAGKTTSIPRAKVRYYGRMSQVLNAYRELGNVIASGDAAAIKKAGKAFWSSSEEAPAEELKSAGYLLAVAFKIDSKIPPDKIPAVKDYKKMMGGVEKLKAAVSSGKAADAAKAYAASTDSLNLYLDAVELPAIGDSRYDNPDTACFFQCGEEAR